VRRHLIVMAVLLSVAACGGDDEAAVDRPVEPVALDLPAVGVAVQLGEEESVVLLSIDGEELERLEGYTLSTLPGGGPLVLMHGGEAVTVDGGRLVPVDGLPLDDGAVLGTGVIRLSSGASVELPAGVIDVSSSRDWVTVRGPNAAGDGYGRTTAYWLGNGEATPVDLDDGCIAADDNGRVPVVLCGHDVRIDDAIVLDHGPFPGNDTGHWTAASLSDDGGWLLLQHSGECESQTGWRLDLASRALTALGPTDEAWDGGGLGWLSDGRIVASFGPGVCGIAFPDGPGVYIESPDGSLELVHAQPDGVNHMGAVLWRQADA
jgi:hypothetical protein